MSAVSLSYTPTHSGDSMMTPASVRGRVCARQESVLSLNTIEEDPLKTFRTKICRVHITAAMLAFGVPVVPAMADDSVASVAALRAASVSGVASGVGIRTSGYYVTGDGGGSFYAWSPSSTDADDGCSSIKPNTISGAGRWLRNRDGSAVLPAAACGVSATQSDNTTALTTAIGFCKGRGNEGKPLCAVILPPGDIRHTGTILLDRGIQLIASPRGSTLLAAAGMTSPGMRVACAHDGFDYYGNAAPPCEITLTGIVLKHEDNADLPGRNAAHGLSLENASSNPVYTRFVSDNLEIYSAPGDGLSAVGFNGFADIKTLYIDKSYRDNLSLNSISDWRISNVDLVYGGHDNAVFSSVGGLNIYGLKSYNAARNNVTIYGSPGALGVNYIYGLAIDGAGQNGVYYDERDPAAVWAILGGNSATNSQITPATYSDFYVTATANSALRIGGGFRFNKPAAGGATSKFNIEFAGGTNTVSALDTLVEAGNPTTANGFSNAPARVLGKGGPVTFDGGIRATGVAPSVRLDDSSNNAQFLAMSMSGGSTALYDSWLGANIAQWDPAGNFYSPIGNGLGTLTYPWAQAIHRGSIYRAPGGVDAVMSYDGNTNRPKIQVYSGGTSTSTGSGTYDFLLNPEGGRVGIGTVAPRGTLEVAGTLVGGFLTLAGPPQTSDIGLNTWTVVKRTDSGGSLKLCGNDGGTIKCIAMAP